MSNKHLSPPKTTPTEQPRSFITVTHVYHPLRGQKLELVHVMRGANSMLVVRHPEGMCIHVPRDWTDFETPQVERTEATDAHLLDINGLCAVAKIISNINTESPC